MPSCPDCESSRARRLLYDGRRGAVGGRARWRAASSLPTSVLPVFRSLTLCQKRTLLTPMPTGCFLTDCQALARVCLSFVRFSNNAVHACPPPPSRTASVAGSTCLTDSSDTDLGYQRCGLPVSVGIVRGGALQGACVYDVPQPPPPAPLQCFPPSPVLRLACSGCPISMRIGVSG